MILPLGRNKSREKGLRFTIAGIFSDTIELLLTLLICVEVDEFVSVLETFLFRQLPIIIINYTNFDFCCLQTISKFKLN